MASPPRLLHDLSMTLLRNCGRFRLQTAVAPKLPPFGSCGFTCTKEVLAPLGTAPKERALGRLRKKLAAHAIRDGVWFDSRAWIVKARRHSNRMGDVHQHIDRSLDR